MLIQNKINFPSFTGNNNQIIFSKPQKLTFLGKPEEDIFEIPEPPLDPDMEKLHELAHKYYLSGNIEDEHELLDQEFQILKQEVEEPQKYLNRAIEMRAMMFTATTRETQADQLRINALCGVAAYLDTLSNLDLLKNCNKAVELMPTLEKILKETPDNNPLAEELKINALDPIYYLYKKLDPASQKRTNDLLVNILKTSPFNDCKKGAFTFLLEFLPKDDPKLKEVLDIVHKQWISEKDPGKKREALVSLGKIRSSQLITIIPEILNDKNSDHSIKVAAIWAAGRVRSEENFNLLSGIINSPENNNEKDLESKEMALHSFALYLRKHPETVKKTLEKISKTDSPLNDAASVLLQKVQGKFNQKDNIINQKISSETEREEYKNLRKNYFNISETLNTRQKNKIDEALLPFKKVLKKLIDGKSKFFILNNTITSKEKHMTGQRNGDGRFWDMIHGVSGYKSTAISKWRLNSPSNITAHEFNHDFCHSVLDEDDFDKLIDLYNKNKKENKFIDYYSAMNASEYFAQGYEAYVSVYKPHKNMINNDNYYLGGNSHVRSVLKRKDPVLYNFVEYCVKKYNLN